MVAEIRAALLALAQGSAAAAPAWMLRPAQAADATRLAALALQVWLSTYAREGVSEDIATYVLARFTPAAFAELLADAQRRLLVAEGPGGLLGYAQLRRGPAQGGLEVELETLYVQAQAQGTGLGRELLAQAQWLAGRELGAPAFWFSVNARNERALNFYRRAGCIQFGETWFELGGGRHLNLLMRTPSL
jgi:ribosomal protein S18 acetylase RimI-like enzyme